MRLIVNFDSVGKSVVLKLSRAPAVVTGSNQGRTVRIGALRGANAQARGEELVSLLGRHDAVKEALTIALSQPPTADPQPIYLRVIPDIADALPWEQLFWKSKGFLALDPRWPVGRIGTIEWELTDRAFIAPFRVVALLSAAQRQGSGQLDALVAAVAAAKERNLNVTLHVITGEMEVKSRVDALGLPFVASEWIGATTADVSRQITDAKPSVLHVLCHGDYVAPGVRGLALASDTDFLAQQPKGSIPLSLAELARALALCDPWLVVLAACETAGATESSSAFARGLVDTGIPAVIGMRRLVDLSAMNRFCDALYPEVLKTVETALRQDAGRPPVRTIDWVTALTAPRQAAIVGVDPTQVDTWSDPVLYAQQDALRVYVHAPNRISAADYAHTAGRLDTLISYRQSLDPITTPVDALNELDTLISHVLAQLPDESDRPAGPGN